VYPPKSRPTASQCKISPARAKRPAGTPPPTFLFLLIHISNSPEPWRFLPIACRRAVEASCLRCDRKPDHLISEVLREARHRAEAGGAPLWGLYRRRLTALSTAGQPNFPATSRCGARRSRRCRRACCGSAPGPGQALGAALAPHSSRVLGIGERSVVTARISGLGERAR
jgi:hypothetical protein